MAEKAVKWTQDQLDAIQTVDRSLLVSAAAGSGKTAVLAERCARLICDGDDPCNVDEILVVTFTNDAAAEMRSRIDQALRERLDKKPDDQRLEKQISLLERAHISTIHGFCNRVIQQHFQILGLSPDFRLLNEEEAALLRLELARDLLHVRHQRAQPQAYQSLLDDYANGSDQRLLDPLLHLHHLLTSVVDPRQWVRDARDRVREIRQAPFHSTRIGQELAALLTGKFQAYIESLDLLGKRFRENPDLAPYAHKLEELKHEAQMRLKLVASGDYDALAERATRYDDPRLPTLKIDKDVREAAQDRLNPLRDRLKKGGDLHTLCRFTTAEWTAGLNAIVSPTIQMLALVRRFTRAYQHAKRSLRAIDFSDQERFALRILQNSPRVVQEYRRQFRHVLVDEFQDINDLQRTMLTLVSREGIDDEKVATNLFTVGDVKQSIYRFRLANPDIFLKRDQAFRNHPSLKGKVIDLQANFRSRGALLEAINHVFEHLMTRRATEIEYDASQRLVPMMTYPAEIGTFPGTPIELHLLEKSPPGAGADQLATDLDDLDSTEREAAFVARRIHELLNENPPRLVCEKSGSGLINRRIAYRNIVVLLRTKKVKAQQFAEQLRIAGVPVHTDSGSGFFDALEIRDCLSLLRLLDNQRQDIPLAAVLRSPLGGLESPEDSLAKIRLKVRDRRPAVPFHQAVRLYAEHGNDDLAAKLRKFFGQIDGWRDLSRRRPIAEVISHILNQSGYLTFCAGLPDGRQRVANLNALQEWAREFGSFQRQGLSRFLDFLGRLEEESDLGQPSLLSETEDAVRVMSIHGSKGLEFPVVIVPDLGKQFNLGDTRGWICADRAQFLGLEAVDADRRARYPSAASIVVQDQLKRNALAEELRVLYVALTRAREHLILVGTAQPDAWDEWRSVWRDWKGPLPVDDLLGANSFLDWLGPSAAAIESSLPGTFSVREWSRSDLDQHIELQKAQRQAGVDPLLCDLVPLKPAPASTQPVQRLLARLSMKYPFEKFSQIPATAPVTRLAKRDYDEPALTAREQWPRKQARLETPRFLETAPVISPADAGTATHVVLQYLDFRAADSVEAIDSQISDLVRRQLIQPELAGVVSREGILWLMQSELGAILKDAQTHLRREMPVYLPHPVEGSTQLDQVMVRGRVDLVALTPGGMIVADYKTDDVEGESLQQRIIQYAPQLSLYADALQNITRQPVHAKFLVFLTARHICQV